MKVFKTSIIIFFIGAAFIFFENYYYKFVDDQHLLHESLFLPIGAILLFVGGIGIVFSLAILVAQHINK